MPEAPSFISVLNAPSVLCDILETRTVQTASGQIVPLHSHIPPDECAILQAWMRAWNPRRVLEVGFAYGVSTLAMLSALEDDVTYHIIDAFQSTEWQNIGVANLERAGYGTAYSLHERLSEIVLPHLLDTDHRFDAAVIDGWHTFDHTLIDFFYVNRMLEVGGHIVFDDVHLPSIQKMLAHVATYPCYTPVAIPPVFMQTTRAKARRMLGIPAYRVTAFEKTEPDNRPWDWHADF